MERLYHEWKSDALERKMQILCFGHQGQRVLAFPPRIGRFSDYEEKGVIDAMAGPIERGMMQVFCFDSVDDESFYALSRSPRERIERHLQYEEFLLHELIPFTHVINPNPSLAAFGCSLGAFHALNLAFRHPSRFQRLIAFSGRYDLTTSPPDFWNLFDGYYDHDIFEHTPSHFLPVLTDPVRTEQIRKMHITLTIGDEDPFLENNREISTAMAEKQIPHRMHIWSGRAHRFRYWRQMARLYF